MRIVTLTSDWNSRDYYTGMLKGRLLSMVSDLNIVENSHFIRPFSTLEGAFVMSMMIPQYPEGTVHLYMVNKGNRPDIFPVLVSFGKQYLIAWEDALPGIFSGPKPELVVRISPDIFASIRSMTGMTSLKVSPSFPELQIFPLLVLAIDKNLNFAELASHEPGLISESPWLPVIQNQTISGRVIYIDSYGNAISNITKSLFDQVRQGRKFDIFLLSNHYRISKLNTGYLETEPGDLLALFNSAGLLEVAIVHGSISELLGLEPGGMIKIKFYD